MAWLVRRPAMHNAPVIVPVQHNKAAVMERAMVQRQPSPALVIALWPHQCAAMESVKQQKSAIKTHKVVLSTVTQDHKLAMRNALASIPAQQHNVVETESKMDLSSAMMETRSMEMAVHPLAQRKYLQQFVAIPSAKALKFATAIPNPALREQQVRKPAIVCALHSSEPAHQFQVLRPQHS